VTLRRFRGQIARRTTEPWDVVFCESSDEVRLDQRSACHQRSWPAQVLAPCEVFICDAEDPLVCEFTVSPPCFLTLTEYERKRHLLLSFLQYDIRHATVRSLWSTGRSRGQACNVVLRTCRLTSQIAATKPCADRKQPFRDSGIRRQWLRARDDSRKSQAYARAILKDVTSPLLRARTNRQA
jgi:hypothetical protein